MDIYYQHQGESDTVTPNTICLIRYIMLTFVYPSIAPACRTRLSASIPMGSPSPLNPISSDHPQHGEWYGSGSGVSYLLQGIGIKILQGLTQDILSHRISATSSPGS